jgi:hypothetical protein
MKHLGRAWVGCVVVATLACGLGCGDQAFVFTLDAGDGAAVADPVLDAGDELAADVDAGEQLEDVHQVLDATAADVDAGELEDVHQVLDATAADVDAVELEDVHQVLDATVLADVDAGELEDVHQVLDAGDELAVDVVDAGAPAADAGPPPFLCVVFAGACSGAYPVECFGNECCNRTCQ